MPKQWKLTSKRLSLKGGKFTHFIGKAWQCKVVLGFLVDYTESLAVDPLLKTVLWAAQNLFGVLSESRTHSLFLLPAEIAQVEAVGKVFLEVYLRLRVKYKGWCIYKLFNVRPKLHILTHVISDVVRVRNPVAASGWMDEDFIKRVMRIARKTHIATTHSSALKRYLAGQGCLCKLSVLDATCVKWVCVCLCSFLGCYPHCAGLQYVLKSGPQFAAADAV